VNAQRILARILTMTGTALRSAGHAIQHALWAREPSRQACPECSVDFAPSLTDERCPVCGWLAAPEAAAAPPRRNVRDLAGVGVAWFVAIVAFALLAHALYA
jgi:hypothetical protein